MQHKLITSTITPILLAGLIIQLSACSGSSNTSNSSTGSSDVSLSFSDAPVDNASAVVITVDEIRFRRVEDDAGSDYVVESFAEDDEEAMDNETFKIDLLSVRGKDQRLVIDSVDLPPGEYSNLFIDVLDGDPNLSYVMDDEGQKELKVPSQTLKLGGFTIREQSKQSFVVEFGLERSMTYNPGPDRYILKPHGVQIVSVDEATHVEVNIDHNALQLLPNGVCPALGDGNTAGSVYLYPDAGADATLGDDYSPDEDDVITATLPVAVASLIGDTVTLSYNEPGDYLLAVRCGNEVDTPGELEGLAIPSPADQLISLSLAPGETKVCSIPIVADSIDAENACGPEAPPVSTPVE